MPYLPEFRTFSHKKVTSCSSRTSAPSRTSRPVAATTCVGQRGVAAAWKNEA